MKKRYVLTQAGREAMGGQEFETVGRSAIEAQASIDGLSIIERAGRLYLSSDEDLAIATEHTIVSAARTLGQRGGSAKSEAKVAASRANGRRGGRPRKA